MSASKAVGQQALRPHATRLGIEAGSLLFIIGEACSNGMTRCARPEKTEMAKVEGTSFELAGLPA